MKEEVGILGSPSLIVWTLSVDVKQHGSQRLGQEPNKDLIRTNSRFGKDHHNSKEAATLNQRRKMRWVLKAAMNHAE